MRYLATINLVSCILGHLDTENPLYSGVFLHISKLIAYFAPNIIGMENKAITLDDVNRFLEQFKVKASVFGIIYRVRDKNEETLFNLGISAQMREKIVLSLEGTDFSHTTLGDVFDEGDVLWVFGKDYKGTELYIKITIIDNGRCLCVSFHEAEHPINYPFKPKED